MVNAAEYSSVVLSAALLLASASCNAAVVYLQGFPSWLTQCIFSRKQRFVTLRPQVAKKKKKMMCMHTHTHYTKVTLSMHGSSQFKTVRHSVRGQDKHWTYNCTACQFVPTRVAKCKSKLRSKRIFKKLGTSFACLHPGLLYLCEVVCMPTLCLLAGLSHQKSLKASSASAGSGRGSSTSITDSAYWSKLLVSSIPQTKGTTGAAKLSTATINHWSALCNTYIVVYYVHGGSLSVSHNAT